MTAEGRSSRASQVSRLHIFSSILLKHEIRHWTDFGTLLGIVRDGILIEEDPDFDFGYAEEDRGRILALNNEILDSTGFRLIVSTEVLRLIPQEINVFGKDDMAIISAAIKRNLLYADLYSFERVGPWMRHLLPYYDFPFYCINSLTPKSVFGFAFPSPSLSTWLLQHRYGPKWRHPISAQIYRSRHESEYVFPFKRPLTCYVEIPSCLVTEDYFSFIQLTLSLFEKVFIGISPTSSVSAFGLERWRMPSSQVVFCQHPERITTAFLNENGFDCAVVGVAKDDTDVSFRRFEEISQEDRLVRIEIDEKTLLQARFHSPFIEAAP